MRNFLSLSTDPLTSPTGPIVSVADRFSSPSPGSAKRRLFAGPNAVSAAQESSTQTPVAGTSSSSLVKQPNPPGGSDVAGSQVGESSGTKDKPGTQVIAFQQALTADGRQVGVMITNVFFCEHDFMVFLNLFFFFFFFVF